MIKSKFNLVQKDRLFYNRYEYCLSFFLPEVNCLRKLGHAYIDETIERRRQWREIAQQRWINGRQNHGVILARNWQEITEQTVKDLHTLAEHLLTTQADYKLVVSVNQGYVYTNDLALIDQLSKLNELSYKTYTRAHVSRPKDTVVLKNPQYQFRTYFKTINLSVQQKDHLMEFLHGQKQIRISPGLKSWVDLPFTRVQDYFFVDHSSKTWTTMLSLVNPGIVRKTLPIVAAK